jgi:hypothetical protein
MAATSLLKRQIEGRPVKELLILASFHKGLTSRIVPLNHRVSQRLSSHLGCESGRRIVFLREFPGTLAYTGRDRRVLHLFIEIYSSQAHLLIARHALKASSTACGDRAPGPRNSENQPR